MYRGIPEVEEMKHKYDEQKGNIINDLLKLSTSPVLWKNNDLSEFLNKLSSLMSVSELEITELRNSMNYTVDKQYRGHTK